LEMVEVLGGLLLRLFQLGVGGFGVGGAGPRGGRFAPSLAGAVARSVISPAPVGAAVLLGFGVVDADPPFVGESHRPRFVALVVVLVIVVGHQLPVVALIEIFLGFACSTLGTSMVRTPLSKLASMRSASAV